MGLFFFFFLLIIVTYLSSLDYFLWKCIVDLLIDFPMGSKFVQWCLCAQEQGQFLAYAEIEWLADWLWGWMGREMAGILIGSSLLIGCWWRYVFLNQPWTLSFHFSLLTSSWVSLGVTSSRSPPYHSDPPKYSRFVCCVFSILNHLCFLFT